MTIDIIGAGISGLATAYYACKYLKDVNIRVWEKEPYPGGLAGSFDFNGVVLEKFYHHIYKTDIAMIELLNELGIGDKLIWRTSTTGYYYVQKNYPFSSPLDLVFFSPLSFRDRIKMGLFALNTKKINDWRNLDNMTAEDYIISHLGKNVYKTLWEPLLRGKFGEEAGNISAAWLWAKFRHRGASRNFLGKEYLGYISGGYHLLFDTLVSNIRKNGHTVSFNAPVTGMEISDNSRITSIAVSNEKFNTDMVVCATQVPEFSSMLPSAFEKYKQSLDAIKFFGNVCLILLSKKSLSKFYWNNIADVSCPFVGIVEHTNWMSSPGYRNLNVVYISSYAAHSDKRFRMESRELLDYYLPYLQKIFPDFKKEYIQAATSWKAIYAQPIVHTGFHEMAPDIRTPIENLLLCTMAQIYPADRQVSNGIEMAKKTVEIIPGKK